MRHFGGILCNPNRLETELWSLSVGAVLKVRRLVAWGLHSTCWKKGTPILKGVFIVCLYLSVCALRFYLVLADTHLYMGYVFYSLYAYGYMCVGVQCVLVIGVC